MSQQVGGPSFEGQTTKPDIKTNLIAAALFSAVAIAVVFLVSVLIALPVYFVARRRLRRLECIATIAVTLSYLVLYAKTWVPQYGQWVLAVVGRPSSTTITGAPWVAFVAVSCLLVACAVLLGGRGVSWFGIRTKPAAFPGAAEEILPTVQERDQLKVVAPPGRALLPSAGSHTLEGAVPVGERSFPVGVGKDGTPVMISEKEIRTHGLIFGSTGSGKALAVDTPIPTVHGWSTMGELRAGDIVFDERGARCRVLYATEVQRDHECFEVTFCDGSSIVADRDHLWALERCTPEGTREVRTTGEVYELVRAVPPVRFRVPAPSALDLDPVDTDDDLYAVGLAAAQSGQPFPACLLRASNEQRTLLFDGVVSTAGSDVASDVKTLLLGSAELAAQVFELARSLGMPARVTGPTTVRIHTDGRCTHSTAPGCSHEEAAFHIVAVRPAASVPVRCIEVDSPSHLFLAGRSMVPTHNTETIKVVAAGLMDLGWSGMILDLKEDAATGGLLDWCGEYADYHAIGFQSFRLSDPEPRYWFNVLHGMGPDEARDTILASQEFEAAYYRALNEKQLGQLVTLLYAAHQVDPVKYVAPTVYGIGKILASPDLPAATREMVATVIANVPGFVKDDFDALIRPDKAMTEAAGGLGARLTAMYNTQVGRKALRDMDGARSAFDVTKTGLSYVGLDSSGKPELTKLVSASVLRRMAVYAADRTSGKVTDKKQRFLIVDEANFVNRRMLLELLSRARSAGIACIVCTQGPTDWQAPAPGEPDLTSLVQNTNVAIIMSQGERTNAELCADIIGRGERAVFNQRVQEGLLTDSASMTMREDYLVSPDALRSLTVGEAVVRVGKPNEWRRYAKILQRDAKLIVPLR